ncbi:MAG: ubiquitin-conjugating enzyme E2 variant [Candidatus Heimdallarchaeaceae archaeon]|jgi:ubiquitin-protein ligase
MTVPDSVLAKEYSLVMERAYAFEPIAGDLTKWRGFVPAISDEGEILVEVEIHLADSFPETPPLVKIITPITHPNLTHDNFLEMRMLARWRSSYHIFQVIVETIRLFSKVPARMIKAEAEAIDPQNQLTPMTKQKEQLTIILEEKKKELNEISAKKPSQVSNKTLQQEKKKHIEDEILNVESEIFAIEQQFEDYEISSIEFAKKFYILKKRLFLLEAQA